MSCGIMHCEDLLHRAGCEQWIVFVEIGLIELDSIGFFLGMLFFYSCGTFDKLVE